MNRFSKSLDYVNLGWHIFPVHTQVGGKCTCGKDHSSSPQSIAKHPIPHNGHLSATRDLEQINQWIERFPNANIGVATGKISGITVLDIDVGKDGFRHLEQFPEIPSTVEARTGSGGSHYFFKYNPNIKSSNGIIAPGIDIKSDGGYIILPPSMHNSNKEYMWMFDQAPGEIKMADAPSWMEGGASNKVDYEKEENYGEGQRDTALTSMAGKLRKAGLKDDEILISLQELNRNRCKPPLSDEQVEKIWRSTIKYRTSDKRKTKGRLAIIVDIMEQDIDLCGMFQYNLFTKDIEYANVPSFSMLGVKNNILSDNDFIELKYYISKEYKVEVPIATLIEASVLMALRRKYHPVRDWVDSLKWDGKHRLDKWLIDYCGCDDNAYIRMVARKILVAAIARVYNPGCKFDFMAILEGSQGIGKSQLVRAIAGDWYLDTYIKGRDKDIVDKFRGAWIVEISELVGFKREDVESLKSFISRQTDRERLSYRRNSEDYPRQCIFIGTHNPSGDNTYFYDDTGNRRFWAIDCRKSDYNGIKKVREQLFAEAKIFYEQGEKLYLDHDDAVRIAEQSQEDRLPIDPWTRPISIYIKGKDMVFAEDILKDALHIPIERQNRGHQMKVGQIMKSMGWLKHRESVGDRRYFYEKEQWNE